MSLEGGRKYHQEEVGWTEACIRELKSQKEWELKFGWQAGVDENGEPKPQGAPGPLRCTRKKSYPDQVSRQ